MVLVKVLLVLLQGPVRVVSDQLSESSIVAHKLTWRASTQLLGSEATRVPLAIEPLTHSLWADAKSASHLPNRGIPLFVSGDDFLTEI